MSIFTNTISTVIRELDRIGFLIHDSEFRAFPYYPKVTEDEYIKGLIDSISSRFFDNHKKRLVQEITGISEHL